MRTKERFQNRKRGYEAFKKIYFILEETTNYLKIGKSDRPEKRIELLQTSTPHHLMLVGIMPEIFGMREEDVHDKFQHLHVRGEWFHFKDELYEFVKENWGSKNGGAGWVFENDEPGIPIPTLGDWVRAGAGATNAQN
jgi:hypothetical protein